uniref:Uncharacterized protein n=1 Tax=Bionectria ochroleuca TaxID=29856 RepID=A0A0B7KM59_BIOOC
MKQGGGHPPSHESGSHHNKRGNGEVDKNRKYKTSVMLNRTEPKNVSMSHRYLLLSLAAPPRFWGAPLSLDTGSSITPSPLAPYEIATWDMAL